MLSALIQPYSRTARTVHSQECEIRTHGLSLPKRALYQTEPIPAIVPRGRFELPRLSASAPKADMSTVPSPGYKRAV